MYCYFYSLLNHYFSLLFTTVASILMMAYHCQSLTNCKEPFKIQTLSVFV